MNKLSELTIPGCSEAIEEMRAISDIISVVSGRKIQIKDKIAALKKEVETALSEQKAAHDRGDRQAYEQAFDKRGSLLGQISSLEKELSAIESPRLRERYETVRRNVYALEAEAEDGVKQAKQKVEERKPLRGRLSVLLGQITQLNS